MSSLLCLIYIVSKLKTVSIDDRRSCHGGFVGDLSEENGQGFFSLVSLLPFSQCSLFNDHLDQVITQQKQQC